ncbi:MAG TPA: DUF1569 domain-containing protein [Planctomicrobium sp.]|nr:DUF1569 domain-containing protein [Planctomicrobium sp.]
MSSLRSLTFTDWDEVEHDLQRLLQGYEQHGNWNLAQMSLHLNDWMSFPMDGFPTVSWPMRMLSALIRGTIGKSLLRKTLAQGFAAGTPTLPVTVHSASEAEDADAVERLRQTMTRFRQFTGKIHASPLFGSMDHQTAEQLQLVHFAHHLRFLKPISPT